MRMVCVCVCVVHLNMPYSLTEYSIYSRWFKMGSSMWKKCARDYLFVWLVISNVECIYDSHIQLNWIQPSSISLIFGIANRVNKSEHSTNSKCYIFLSSNMQFHMKSLSLSCNKFAHVQFKYQLQLVLQSSGVVLRKCSYVTTIHCKK